jgi:isoleucyl-tRNA synthetase
VKDRLYTDAANSHRRRATQTALHRLVTGLCRMLSPLLVFTTDEAWEFLPNRRTDSVHEAEWKLAPSGVQTDHETWNSLLALRERVLADLEKARQSKLIGKALEAKVVIKGKGENAHLWQKEEESLRELLNVSQLFLQAESVDPFEVPAAEIAPPNKPSKPYFKKLIVEVSKADGQKCERCWHWETDVGSNPEHPTICARCVAAVKENLASASS